MNNRLVLISTSTAAALAAGASLLYCYHSYSRIVSSVQYTIRSGTVSSLPLAQRFESAPAEVFDSGEYFSIYDQATKVVATDSVPSSSTISNPYTTSKENKNADLLTLFLRRTMTMFLSSPQAKIVYLTLRWSSASSLHALQQSFSPAHINTLDFKEGDLVCGAYAVLLRTPTRCEIELRNPFESSDHESKMGGRMVILYENVGENRTRFTTEVVMWRRADDKRTVLPMERTVPRLMHQVIEAYLLDSGVRYLMEQKEK